MLLLNFACSEICWKLAPMLMQNLFEKHNVVFTVAGGLLSAGAAWAGETFV